MKVLDFLQKDMLEHVPEHLDTDTRWFFETFDVNYGLIDRSAGNLPTWLESTCPIPVPQTPVSFEEAALARAQSLIQEGKPIDLYWSGGFDSTVALCALHALNVAKDQLTIHFTDLSIAEYPRMFRELVRGYQHKKHPLFFTEIEVTGGLIVNGECGDQVFGSQTLRSQNKKVNGHVISVKAGRETNFDTDWRQLPFVDEAPQALWDFVQRAPFPIETRYDFFWWFDFATHWQHMKLRMGNYLDKEQFAIFARQVRPFFDSIEFQCWAMDEQNHRELKQPHWKKTKLPAREFIYSVFKDEVYRDTKYKIGSLPTVYRTTNLARFADGTKVSTRQEFFDKLTEHS